MKKFFATLTAAAALMAFADGANAGAVADTLFYTTGGSGQNVWKVTSIYSGNGAAGSGTFALSGDTNIASTPAADGIVLNPNNGQLLVGGGGGISQIFQVDPNTGAFASATPRIPAVDLAVDPNKLVVWAAGSEAGASSISSVPINPFGAPGTTTNVSGSDSSVTHIAFVPGATPGTFTAFYTNSPTIGIGNFGKIDLATGKTTALLTNVIAAHGMVFDPFSGDLILGGGNQVAQIDPTTGIIVSSRTFDNGEQFDQGGVDGLGHVFWTDNGGKLLFIDYSGTHRVGDPANFISNAFFKNRLEGIALGAGGASQIPVPEPTTLAFFATGFAGLALARRHKKA